jgi:hypothetical protein
MNEEQIERWYEREMDALDAELLSGVITQKEYDQATKELAQEVNATYHGLRNPNCLF